MKLTTAVLIAAALPAFAESPLVEFIDTQHPSKDEPNAVLNLPDGRHPVVHLRTFGSERVEEAINYGRSVKGRLNADRQIWEKAAGLYPGDRFFQKAFHQFASGV